MPEVQSCSSLVNPSALLARSRVCSLDFSAPWECKDQQVLEVENVDRVIAELSAELQKERKKNAELMEKVSLLEAQIEERDKGSHPKAKRDDCTIVDRSFKKFKRQKIEPRNDEVEHKGCAEIDNLTPEIKHDTSCMDLEDGTAQQDRLVNWMSLDDIQFLNFENFKDGDCTADCEDTDDTDDEDNKYCDDDDADSDDNGRKVDENPQFDDTLNTHIKEENIDGGQKDQAVINMLREISGDLLLPKTRSIMDKKELKKHKRRVNKKVIGCKELFETSIVGQDIGNKGFGNILSHKTQPKLPFCPKEVKRMIGSEALLLKNAQSHTIQKIIVFASLGIQHGCEDMYDLDFNHFSILRKGEPYVSATNPGEHVLYEHPGVRRKIFYPNKQNPTLCPVRILEEEKAMRPSDPSCPSCLFLCIKYGGRTRNLPQNEYVRQRMGRNKLKSFGPLMCQMAMLVNVRSGSFFFKALGITLLFMAGFPDDLVHKETKYRNLDLLQKYYRKDEDAEGEELFHLYPMSSDAVSPTSQALTAKTTKPSGRKQLGSTKPQNLPVMPIIPSGPSSSSPPPQFGLMGYASLQPQAMAAFQSIPPHTVKDTLSPPPNPLTTSSPNIPYHTSYTATPYSIFPPPPPPNTFIPMVYWPPTNAFPTCPYPPTYGYQSFPPSANYLSLHPQPYYGHPPCTPFMTLPEVVEDFMKKNENLGEADSNSGSSSSSSEPKKE